MIETTQRRRRWFGVFFLIIAGGMLIWGLTLLEPLLVGIRFVFYWLVCLTMTLAAFGVGYADLRAVRREQRRQLDELVKSTLVIEPVARGESEDDSLSDSIKLWE